MNIAIVGYGYWGPNLVRNFNAVPNCSVKYVVDAREDRLKQVMHQYPNVIGVTQIEEVLSDIAVHAVVIATPVFTHFDLAAKALLAGKHVLVEKPLTSKLSDAEELLRISKAENKLLMVDHTFLYTGAVEYMKRIADDGSIGNITYIDSTRINLGLFQPDVNVLWDLAPHDISIANFIMNQRPIALNATGISHTGNGIENIAYLTLYYPDNKIAHFNCSWSSPVKIRQMLVGGDKKMVLFNDLEATEKIRIYDTGYDLKSDEDKRSILVDYRAGDIYIPKVGRQEALYAMAKDFVDCIIENRQPISNADAGVEVVKILEAAEYSIKNGGIRIELKN